MLKDNLFRVAGFTFSVRISERYDTRRLLPSFRNFRLDGAPNGEPLLFRFEEVTELAAPRGPVVLLEDTVNDTGHTRLLQTAGGYRIEMHYPGTGRPHCLQADPRFTSVAATICREDPHLGEMLSAMLRIVFSQAVVWHKSVSVHAAAVVADGEAYLFTGKSGTGKSTHATLWRQCFPGCELLNDDNPMVRVIGGKVVVCGTPWSGKTACYRNLTYPVRGIAQLRQARENRFTIQREADAFITLLPCCSAIRQDSGQYAALCDTLVFLAERVPVGQMACRPDKAAPPICRKGFNDTQSTSHKL